MLKNIEEMVSEGIKGLIPYKPGKPMEELERELGITDSNLALITIDGKSSPVITADNSEVQAPVEVVVPEADAPLATSTPDSVIGETATTSPDVIVDNTDNAATSTCVWLAEYFDNKNLFGTPIATSSVNAIDFDWGTGGPEQFYFFDRFSIRYTANCNFLDGNYEFRTFEDIYPTLSRFVNISSRICWKSCNGPRQSRID